MRLKIAILLAANLALGGCGNGPPDSSEVTSSPEPTIGNGLHIIGEGRLVQHGYYYTTAGPDGGTHCFYRLSTRMPQNPYAPDFDAIIKANASIGSQTVFIPNEAVVFESENCHPWTKVR